MRKWKWLVPSLMAGALFALAACGSPEATPTPTPEAGTTPDPGGAGWEAEWQEVLDGARQEGRISIISGNTATNHIPAFETAFQELTGGDVEFTELQAPVIVSRLPEEYAAGQHNWDIILLGGSSGISEGLDRAGVLGNLNDAFIFPDITEEETWEGGFSDMWVDNDTKEYKFHHFGTLSQGSQWWVNTEHVSLDQLSDIENVFDIPGIQGRFCTFDPRVEGAADANFGQIAGMYGSEMVRRLFTELDMVVTRDIGKITEDTIRGECWISVGTRIPNFHAQGVGLHVQPVYIFRPGIHEEFADRLELTCCGEGKNADRLDGWVGGGSAFNFLAIAKNPPNPNAAKVFVNWLLSEEGQMAWALPQTTSECSRRADLQEWCAEQWADSPFDWQPMEEGDALISTHTRSNYFLRTVSHEIGFEVFGR